MRWSLAIGLLTHIILVCSFSAIAIVHSYILIIYVALSIAIPPTLLCGVVILDIHCLCIGLRFLLCVVSSIVELLPTTPCLTRASSLHLVVFIDLWIDLVITLAFVFSLVYSVHHFCYHFDSFGVKALK